MHVRSKYQCGYRRDGGVLLKQGDNDIDEKALTASEKAFIAALVKAGVARMDPYPLAVVEDEPALEKSDEPVEAPTEAPPTNDAPTTPERESAPVVVEARRKSGRERKIRRAG